MVLVGLAARYAGDESLPDARTIGALRQGMGVNIPVIELPHDRYERGVGRPHAEICALGLALRAEMTPQTVVEPAVGALAKQINVVIGKHGVGSVAMTLLKLERS